MSLFRTAVGPAALVSWLALAAPAFPGPRPAVLPPLLGATELFASDARSGLALSGYDPVSYLVDGEPRAGLFGQEAIHAGLAWRFSSRANQEAFLRDPAAFLPAAGGYDATAAASGRVVSADPLLFATRAGRLYLFRTVESRRRFLGDEGAAEAAELGWRRLRSGLVRS